MLFTMESYSGDIACDFRDFRIYRYIKTNKSSFFFIEMIYLSAYGIINMFIVFSL